jgi:SAM-dependent methyltransferase
VTTNLAQAHRDSIYRLSELAWDFHGDKSDSPFSDLHFHPGRFVPQIPAALVGTLTTPGECVLDPFCGAGTTLVEAQRLGRSAVGIDLNPVSCLVSRTKTVAASAQKIETLLLHSLDQLTAFRIESIGTPSAVPHEPPTVQLQKWYHAETGEELRRIWAFICTENDPLTRDLLQFCFSSSLMACCAETRSWGYVCDNVRPLERRYVDADATFRDKLEALVDAFRRRDRRRTAGLDRAHTPVTVVQGDAMARIAELKACSIDLVVTSPPYFGVVDYVKSQRLTLEWLGLATEPLRSGETGARSKRHRQAAFEEYANELALTIGQLHRVLKPGRMLTMVIGESAKREPVLSRVQDVLRGQGFTIDLTINRKIGLRRRQPASLETELLIVARRD